MLLHDEFKSQSQEKRLLKCRKKRLCLTKKTFKCVSLKESIEHAICALHIASSHLVILIAIIKKWREVKKKSLNDLLCMRPYCMWDSLQWTQWINHEFFVRKKATTASCYGCCCCTNFKLLDMCKMRQRRTSPKLNEEKKILCVLLIKGVQLKAIKRKWRLIALDNYHGISDISYHVARRSSNSNNTKINLQCELLLERQKISLMVACNYDLSSLKISNR